jgi:hypothetical protein
VGPLFEAEAADTPRNCTASAGLSRHETGPLVKFTLNKIVSKIVEKVGKTVKNRAQNGFLD